MATGGHGTARRDFAPILLGSETSRRSLGAAWVFLIRV